MAAAPAPTPAPDPPAAPIEVITGRARSAGGGGDPDVSKVAAMFADASRARMLSALTDGRALPASRLASEAGVSAATVSGHLTRLLDAGLVTVTRSGRFRFYRLAGPRVAQALEALTALSKPRPITSLRASTRAARLRAARSCYDHLAGRFGVAVTATLVDRGVLVRTDGLTGVCAAPGDRYSAPVAEIPYRLGGAAGAGLADWGVDLDRVLQESGSRPPLRFCMDWTEQQHHLAGALGAAVLDAFVRRGWVQRGSQPRELTVTDAGLQSLADSTGVRPD
ncbi:ArsR/SmtB family transcription factor [Nakamurella lactea]|uniref:ArsR/SmtB family transcription factor n=1 Tax=Nakamurella lactea TaxID=459515 RepID=UPI00041260D0|nr:metalloregulator ArsR/SmtB family transcription factor [Nakamurella lactea]